METEETTITAPAQVLSTAFKTLSEAQERHTAVLLSASESEARMRELQQEAEDAHLSIVEAEAEADEATRNLQVFIDEAERARIAHQEALAVLEEAQRLVEETEQEYLSAEGLRNLNEQEMVPVFVRLGAAQTVYARFRALAELEDAQLRRELASAEEAVSRIRVSLCDARLQLLEAPVSSEMWPEVKALLGEGC